MTVEQLRKLLESFRVEIISLYPPKFKLIDLNPSDNINCSGELAYDSNSKTFKLSMNIDIKL